MSSQSVSSEEDGDDLSEKLRILNLNDGVLRFEKNYLKCDGFWFQYVLGDLMHSNV